MTPIETQQIHARASDAAAGRGGVKIEARGVERVFESKNREVRALGPFDLDIADGEFVCLVGPSGCGKSTFLRMVAGLARPSAGTVRVSVRDTSRPPTAMVFQDYSIYPWRTVLANVRFGLEVQGVSKKEAERRALDSISRLGLAEFTKSYPHELSGGMRQRVSIARALAMEPEILLMDEPFAALDAQMRTILQEELLALWEADRRTVLFVTHSLEEAILLADRVVVMTARPGKLLDDKVIPFDRPRSVAIRQSPEFAALHEELWEHLRREVTP
ncbi:ABC transporter ATP-binding protein [Amycolatopsis taiwanensis]|uniref:Nitrate ABC transporter ATP-binding protein n=1 Tax=Amycolatopsis taiwanensis TaxID=342230 RepID=A0A9W6R6V6_9PSEU|nr:ABC transporter ATP-binding protein [Amycolatopsis taiwanensis]GLY70504.1 nitrate ABC transporter ATP-binding protein [Amycolatopsis taiwanensis]